MSENPTAATTVARRAGRGLAWSTVSSLVLRMGNFGVGILVARLIAPEQFGVFAVALTVQSVVLAVVELGLTAYLVRQGNISTHAPTATTVSVGLGAVLALGMVGLAGPVAALMGTEAAAPVIRVMAISLIISALSTVPHAAMQRAFRQSAQFVVDGCGLVLNAVTVIVLVRAGFGAMSLAVASVVSLGLTCALQYWMTRTRPRFGFDRTVATSLVRFGVPLAMANLLSWVVMNSAFVVVGWHSGPLLLGFYVLAFNMASWPMTSIGLALRVVALPAFSHLPPDRRAAALRPAVALSWSVALLVGVLLSALASALIGIVYGEKWLPAAAALTGLALFGAQRVLFDLLASFLIAAGAIRQVFVVQLVWLVALIPGLLLGLSLGGLAGAAWAPAVVGVAVAVPAYLVAVRGQGVQLGPVVGAIVLPILVGLPTLLLGGVIADTLAARWLAVFAVGAVVTGIYGAVLFAWLHRQVGAVRTITDVRLADDDPAHDMEVPA